MLGAAVDDDIANQICAQLLYLEGEDPNRDIWLYVNSPGGRSRPAWRSTTRCSSSAATSPRSASGSPPRWASSCSPPARAGKRYTLPNARIMMHQPLAGLRGQAADIAIQAEAVRLHQAAHGRADR